MEVYRAVFDQGEFRKTVALSTTVDDLVRELKFLYDRGLSMSSHIDVAVVNVPEQSFAAQIVKREGYCCVTNQLGDHSVVRELIGLRALRTEVVRLPFIDSITAVKDKPAPGGV